MPLTVYEVVVNGPQLKGIVEKSDAVETSTRYDVAPVTGVQEKVSVVACPVAPLLGLNWVGAGIDRSPVPAVVNERVGDQAPVAIVFPARHRQ